MLIFKWEEMGVGYIWQDREIVLNKVCMSNAVNKSLHLYIKRKHNKL